MACFVSSVREQAGNASALAFTKRKGITVSHVLAAAVACLACTVPLLDEGLYKKGTAVILRQLFYHYSDQAAASYIAATWNPHSTISSLVAQPPDSATQKASPAHGKWQELRHRRRLKRPTFDRRQSVTLTCESSGWGLGDSIMRSFARSFRAPPLLEDAW